MSLIITLASVIRCWVSKDVCSFYTCYLLYTAEYVIHLHDESKNLEEFAAKLQEAGDAFAPSFIANLDRLITTLKPKKKNEQVGEVNVLVEDKDELERRARMFPGLALPNSTALDEGRVSVLQIQQLHEAYFYNSHLE
jgi:hypothetical protein